MTTYAAYDPTPLIAGDFDLASRPITVAMGQNTSGTVLPKGSVMGQKTADGATSAVKASGANTGNGTLALDGSTPVLRNSRAGVYSVRFTAATTFRVTDPLGDVLGDGTAGAAFADQVKFVATAGGTPFVAGDGFDITVTGSNKYVVSRATATDGSQVPLCVTTDDVDASAADIVSHAYFTGQFAFEIANVDGSWTIDTLNQAFVSRGSSIFFRSVGAVP